MRVSQVSFNGQFHCNKLKPKQAKCLQEILTTKCDGISNEELLNGMSFNVDVVCYNPTKKAINPRFGFYITHTKKQATLIGNIRLTSKNPPEENSKKLNKFITNFNEKFQQLRGDEKLSRAEETQRQVDFLLFGRYGR